MKKLINLYEFRDAFRDMAREDNFSHEGLKALFDWLEDLGDDIGEEVELDVIALCCEFAEYTLEELQREIGDYAGETWEDMDQAIEYLQDHTTVIVVDSARVIIQNY